ncbi:MAG TPA: hypothetical protein VK879_09295, partial [Candidatus Sulfomarinibacteraceae bacterium]|nr:hypothetical protein [Candidatus Sulfomarinibacteraceae bacterium]
MTQPLTPTAQYTALIPGIQEFAQFIVEEIRDFQPDLLIGLAHSGWLPLLAAQTVWGCHHGTPFPPALRLNFGQEKLDPHNELWGQTDHNELGLDRAPFPFLAHVLYWAGEQAQWREELAQMATAVLGSLSPRRIIVVDEGVMDGTTYWPLMGLLTAVYPQAEIRFSSGHFFHWGNHATDAWLEQHAPDALAHLQAAKAQLATYSPERRQLRDALRWVAAGTEDGDPHSLHCLPVDENSQSVRLLTPYLPAAQWLRIAPWAHQTLLAQVREMALAQPGPLPPDKHRSYRASQRRGLPDEIALIRYIWQQGSVTRRDVAAWGNLSLSEASRRLRRLARWGDIAAQGWGGGTRYAPDPVYRPEFAETFGGPDNNAYWVVPGKLLAGPHPLTTEGFCHEAYQGLSWLRAQGIDCLLDLAG